MRMQAGQIDIGLDEAWRTSMPFRQRAEVTALTWPLLRHYSDSGMGTPAAVENKSGGIRGNGREVTVTVTNWPSVSAVIPTRDRPELLARAVRSVLGQRYPGPLECVVVFDQQAPRMPDVEVPEGRSIRTIENDHTPGLAGARNAGAASCRSELLAWCDDDDEWLPDKLQRQVEAMQAHPGGGGGHVWHLGVCRDPQLPAQPGTARRGTRRAAAFPADVDPLHHPADQAGPVLR